MTHAIYAFTADPEIDLRLTLADDAAEEFHALPPLPRDTPEDFEAPDVIVTDEVTGRTYLLSRFPCGAGCGCAAYAEDITESWEAFLAAEEAAGR